MNVTRLLCSALPLFGLSASLLSGQALINEKYGEVAIGYKQLETGALAGDIDLYTVRIHANAPYYQNNRLGVDLFSTLFLDNDAESGVTYYDAGFLAGATGYYHLNGHVSPFIRGAAGYGWEKITVGAMTRRDDGFIYEVGAGVELLFSEDFSLTPEIKYRDRMDGEGSRMIYGIRGQFWLNESWGIGASYTVDDGSSGNFDAKAFSVSFTFNY